MEYKQERLHVRLVPTRFAHVFDVHVTKWQSDWPEFFEMARTKEPPQIYQTTLFVTIHFVSGSGRMGTRLLH